ncbi:ArnT family glycosyltransferase [Sinomicrobium sp.]
MKVIKQKERRFLIFLCVLTLVNMIQGGITELIFDEAYYWYFSQNLNWGYFDHPPMVAFLASLGTILFDHELGVRFFAPFLFSGTIYLLWKLIDDDSKYKHTETFILFSASVALFNVYGFFMLPDTPLLFFSALFLYAFKRFIKQADITAVLLLSISMAAMMYSKYHAFLFIVFALFSYPAILLKYRFWIALVLSLILYTPHLFWLYDSNFVSLKYHLSERANSDWRPSFTLNYLLNVLIVPGFSFPLIYLALYRFSGFSTLKKNSFDRVLVVISWGIIGFFLLSSFNRKTQAQWPLLTLLPLIVLTFRYCLKHDRFRLWLYRTSMVSFVVMGIARICLSFGEISPFTYESHGNKEWTKALYEETDGLPVVFENSYRMASMYSFYTRVPVYSLNSIKHRQNQYDIDDSEVFMQHQKVACFSSRKDTDSTFNMNINLRKGSLWKGKIIDDFKSFRKLNCSVYQNSISPASDSLTLMLTNPYTEGVPLQKLKFYGLVLDEKKRITDTVNIAPSLTENVKVLSPRSSIEFRAGLDSIHKLDRGTLFRVSISEYGWPSGFQGKVIPIGNISL